MIILGNTQIKFDKFPDGTMLMKLDPHEMVWDDVFGWVRQ